MEGARLAARWALESMDLDTGDTVQIVKHIFAGPENPMTVAINETDTITVRVLGLIVATCLEHLYQGDWARLLC